MTDLEIKTMSDNLTMDDVLAVLTFSHKRTHERMMVMLRTADIPNVKIVYTDAVGHIVEKPSSGMNDLVLNVGGELAYFDSRPDFRRCVLLGHNLPNAVYFAPGQRTFSEEPYVKQF